MPRIIPSRKSSGSSRRDTLAGVVVVVGARHPPQGVRVREVEIGVGCAHGRSDAVGPTPVPPAPCRRGSWSRGPDGGLNSRGRSDPLVAQRAHRRPRIDLRRVGHPAAPPPSAPAPARRRRPATGHPHRRAALDSTYPSSMPRASARYRFTPSNPPTTARFHPSRPGQRRPGHSRSAHRRHTPSRSATHAPRVPATSPGLRRNVGIHRGTDRIEAALPHRVEEPREHHPPRPHRSHRIRAAAPTAARNDAINTARP